MIRLLYEFCTIKVPKIIEELRLELVYAGILSPKIISLRDLYYNNKYYVLYGLNINRYYKNHIDVLFKLILIRKPKTAHCSNPRLLKHVVNKYKFYNDIMYTDSYKSEINASGFLGKILVNDKYCCEYSGIIPKEFWRYYDCTLDYAIIDEKRRKRREKLLQKRFEKSGNKCIFAKLFSRISKKVLELYNIKRRRLQNEINRIGEFDPYENIRTERVPIDIPQPTRSIETDIEAI